MVVNVERMMTSNLFPFASLQVGCGAALLLDRQSKIIAELQDDVVAGNPALLSQHSRFVGWLQERSAVYVLRRDLFVLFQGSQSVYAVRLPSVHEPVLI